MESLNTVLNILKVAFGLGLVIFLHELGHFLLAKWNGVKVEKFSIGFGPTLLGFTKGETEYVLAAVPLGGFVKMLGEGPDEETAKSSDPRAYPNKSVGARMAIISAGVIMNLILGLCCFVYAYGQGMEEGSTRIGSVVAGTPAYAAGIRPGDEIVEIDGRRDLSYGTVQLKVRLSGAGQAIRFALKRPGQAAEVPMTIEPRREANADVPGIGIYPSSSLILSSAPNVPFLAPAGMTDPPKNHFVGGDRVVAVGPVGSEPTPVEDAQALNRLLAKYADKPLTVVVEQGPTAGATSPAPAAARVPVALPPNRFVDFGLRFRAEPIAAVRGDSIAEKAGLRSGDVILKVDGADFDPMQLPTYCHGKAGKPVAFEISRPEAAGAAKTLTVTVTPDDTPPWVEVALPNEPLEVSGVGFAYHVGTKVDDVRPGSPADKAGIKRGETITSITIPELKIDKETRKAEVVPLNETSKGWAWAFQMIQSQPLGPIELVVNNSNKPLRVTPEPVADWYNPRRGLRFDLLFQTVPPLGAQAALRRGFDDTVDNILSIYAMLRSLVQSRVSPKNLGGPIAIATVAYSAAGSSLTDLVRFLGILSINLAVLNFLPIPPLDGGQMVFLLAEKVRGRPLPDSAVIGGTYIGLFLVMSLMAFVIYQDVSRLVTGWF